MPEEVLWKYSFANIIMLVETVPEYDPEDEEETRVNSTKELTAEILKKHTNLKF
jgi:hypothetical protein